jgi:hypothetical protein
MCILLFLLLTAAWLPAQIGLSTQSSGGVRLRNRSSAEVLGAQRILLSNFCRLDFDGARLQPDAWTRVKPFTTLRPAEGWPRIFIVTRWDFEVLEEARDSQIVTYKLTGVYDLAEGYSAISASEQVQFVMHEHDGNLVITAITPDAPHLSARAALAWMRQRLNDAGTSDPERAHLRDAITQIERQATPITR